MKAKSFWEKPGGEEDEDGDHSAHNPAVKRRKAETILGKTRWRRGGRRKSFSAKPCGEEKEDRDYSGQNPAAKGMKTGILLGKTKRQGG